MLRGFGRITSIILIPKDFSIGSREWVKRHFTPVTTTITTTNHEDLHTTPILFYYVLLLKLNASRGHFRKFPSLIRCTMKK